jgi:hypothetical protein
MSFNDTHTKQQQQNDISFSINTNDLNDDNVYIKKMIVEQPVVERSSSIRSSSFKEDATFNDACLAEEEDSTISGTSSILIITAKHTNGTNDNTSGIVHFTIKNDNYSILFPFLRTFSIQKTI